MHLCGEWSKTRSNGARLGLAFVTAVTRAGHPRCVLNVSSRRVWQYVPNALDDSPGREEQEAGNVQAFVRVLHWASRAAWGARRACAGARGRRSDPSDGPGALAAQPPRADRRLSHLLRICSCRGLAQHGEHGRVAAASTKSSTSTSSGAGACTRSAGGSRWRPHATRRPPHSTLTGFHRARR